MNNGNHNSDQLYSKFEVKYGFSPNIETFREWNTVKASSSFNSDIDPHRPMIALTFDDGPSEHTPRLLDAFAASGGKGTFLIMGDNLDNGAETLKRIYNEGHEIGNHTRTHPCLIELSEEEIIDEIMSTRAKIHQITGHDCCLIRPPYGSTNDTVISVAKRLGIGFVNWSIDTVDWHTKNADAVHNVIMERAEDGGIVLCHDNHGTTVDAMERVIPELVSAGYQLVTVSELMAHSGKPFEAGAIYNKR